VSRWLAGQPGQRSGRLAIIGLAGAFLLLLGACSGAPARPEPPVMPVVTAPQPPASPPVIVPPAPVPPPNTVAGHVASYKSVAEAEAAWPRLLERFPVLKDQSKRFVEFDLGPHRGKVVRLLVGGFSDHDHASQFCHKLRSSGVFCAPHEIPVDTRAEAKT
jgi:hypothetical protein